ncbi:hypothetical protein ACKRLN_07445 [Anaerococcus sp. DFU013_CI05]|uniref:hypothetical protein n=1 Tax=Anaerococcus sp. AH8042_DFU013_CI05 TaxID=3385202 RepID=UPI003A520EEE
MNKKFVKVLAAVTVSSVLGANISYAATEPVRKSETIYVTKEDNKIVDETASIWLNGDENIKTKDKTNLKDIKNLETDEAIDANNGYIDWKTEEKDIYYQGKTNGELPIDVSVKYFLDGKEVKASELEGKSGHLKIVAESTNKKSTSAKIDGKETNIFSPYAVATAMIFDGDKVSNITSDSGKIVKDGKNQVVTGLLTPGLKENFADVLDADKLDKFKDKIEVEMDVTDYKQSEIYTLITNEFFQEDTNLASLDDLNEGIDKLENNMTKLVDASDELENGGKQINDGISQLNAGAGKLSDGSAKILANFEKLGDAFADLPGQVSVMTNAVNQLSDGSNNLNAGINKYTAGVSQVNQNMPALNQGAKELQNGATELDNGIAQLNQATSELKEKTAMSSKAGDQKTSSLTDSLGQLQKGLDDFGQNITPLANSVDELNGGLTKLSDASANMTSNIEKLSESANGINVETSLENIYSQANAIDNVIANLEGNNEDGTLSEQIENLAAIKNGLYGEAENLKASAQISTGVKAGLNELNQASGELTAGINQANAGSKEISTKVSASKDELAKASTSLSAGVEKINKGFSESNLAKLQESIAMLDGATSKIKAGSSKLKEGAIQNTAGVEKLSGAINELDQNSAQLANGSQKLSNGLEEFKNKSQSLNQLSNINETAINPLADALRQLNTGLNELNQSTGKLKEGSDKYEAGYHEFAQGLKDYKSQGIDELTNKTGDVQKVSDILDQMSKLAKENNSISGSTDDFETRSRIIEKIK